MGGNILSGVLEERSFLDMNIGNSIPILVNYYSMHGIFYDPYYDSNQN